MFTLYFDELNAPPFLKSYRPPWASGNTYTIVIRPPSRVRPVSSVASIDNDQRRTRVVVAPERRRRVAEDDDGGANAARKIVVIFALEFVVPHKVG